jgi:hypothetical protein
VISRKENGSISLKTRSCEREGQAGCRMLSEFGYVGWAVRVFPSVQCSLNRITNFAYYRHVLVFDWTLDIELRRYSMTFDMPTRTGSRCIVPLPSIVHDLISRFLRLSFILISFVWISSPPALASEHP